MNSKDNLGEPEIYQSWIGGVVIRVIIAIAIVAFFSWLTSCSPKIVEHVVTKIEYRDREVHDTTTFEITKEIEKIVTRDTVSHLENKYGKSDATVSGGYLTHSLETKPQIVKVPVTVTVTDTLIKEAEIKEIIKEVDKPLSGWRKFQIGAFWWILGAVVLLLLWTFRKLIFRIP